LKRRVREHNLQARQGFEQEVDDKIDASVATVESGATGKNRHVDLDEKMLKALVPELKSVGSGSESGDQLEDTEDFYINEETKEVEEI